VPLSWWFFSIARLYAIQPAGPSASLSYGREIDAGCVLERLWVDPVFDHIQGSSGDCNWVVLVFDFCSKVTQEFYDLVGSVYQIR